MHCKNCGTTLGELDNFCPNCGGKVIRKRLTVKNLFAHALEQFLNIDNKFASTFVDLFKRPETVIGGYIKGTRGKYINPISYFAIALTVAGLFLFIQKKFAPEIYETVFEVMQSISSDSSSKNPELDAYLKGISESYMGFVFDYQSLLYSLFIPFMAIMAMLIFIDKKRFNFVETMVIFLYGYSHITMLINVVFIGLLWSPKLFAYLSVVSVIIYIIFHTHVLRRLYQLSVSGILIRLMLFIPLFIVLYFAISMVVFTTTMFMTDSFDEFMEIIRSQAESKK